MRKFLIIAALVSSLGIAVWMARGDTIRPRVCTPEDEGQPQCFPSCASLGCPLAPSGTPDVWSPCTDDRAVCWCPKNGVFVMCRR